MAYIKTCNFCGQKISMREMRHGQWVAFDASTETPHKCGYQTEPDPNIAALGKKTKREEPGGIDVGYSDVTSEEIKQARNEDVTEVDNTVEQTPWIDERAKVADEKKHTHVPYSDDLPWIEDRGKTQVKTDNIIQSTKPTISSENKKEYQFKNKHSNEPHFKNNPSVSSKSDNLIFKIVGASILAGFFFFLFSSMYE